MEVPKPVGEALSVVREGVQTYGKSFVCQTFARPDGTTYDFLMLRFRTVPAIIMALTENNEVIVEHQFREAANRVITEVPGGNPKSQQSLEETVVDELIRETGYRPATIIRLQDEAIWFDPASFGVPYVPVLALGCQKFCDPQPDPNEFIEVEVVPLAEWFDLIKQGRVNDSKSLALTMLIAVFLDFVDLSRLKR